MQIDFAKELRPPNKAIHHSHEREVIWPHKHSSARKEGFFMALRLHSTRFSFALLSFTVRRTHSLCKKKHVGCPSCLIRHKSDVTLPRFQLYSFLCVSSFAAPAQLDAIFRVCRHSIFSPINPTPSGMPELFTVFSPHQPQEAHQSDLNCYKCITRPCEVTWAIRPPGLYTMA